MKIRITYLSSFENGSVSHDLSGCITFTKKLSFVFILLLSTMVGISQEICDNGIDDDGDGLIDLQDVDDCTCLSTIEYSVVGDFEMYTCCPMGPTIFPGSGIACLDGGWQSPGMGTPDYYHTCGYLGLAPWFAPLPFPSGEGCIGMYNGTFVSNDFNEQIALCLPYEMIPGFTYSFGFYLGFTVDTIVSPLQVDVHLQGTNDCGNFPINSLSCVMDFPDWYEMTSLVATGASDSWILVQTTFVATESTTAISLGLECGSDAQLYHFVDSIYLHGEFLNAPTFDVEITGSGDCLSGVTLMVPSTPGNSYQWYLDSVAISAATSNSLLVSPIIGGTYQVAIVDGLNCNLSLPYELDVDFEVIVIDELVNQIICHNDNNASINIDAQSPNDPLSYQWNSGEDVEDLIDLEAGEYTVTVTDVNGCYGIESYIITNPDSLIGIISITQPANGQQGSALAFGSGGQPDYFYNWSQGSMAQSANNLIPGLHSVTITDELGCVVIIPFEIFEELTAQEQVLHDSCGQSCTGAISVVVSGGLPTYSIAWNNSSEEFTQTNLCPGIYSYVVVDILGTIYTDTIVVLAAEPVGIISFYDEFVCDTNSVTTIRLAPESGQLPFSYRWSTNAIDSFIQVSSGGYSVTVTDSRNCQLVENFNISLNPAIELSADITHDDCDTTPSGEIELSILGGNPPYHLEWFDGDTTTYRRNLSPGIYTVFILDSLGCTDTAQYEVESPTLLMVDAAIEFASCGGGADGRIELSIAGGLRPYHISWEGGIQDSILTNLESGSYAVTVTDVNNCQSIYTFVVLEDAEISIDVEFVLLQCPGDESGMISINISGGSEPYLIDWSTGGMDTFITNLPAGQYGVTVTDDQNCINFQTYVIDEIAPLVITELISQPLCFGDNGVIDLTVEGGTMPYSYRWNNGETTNSISALGSSAYAVTVLDGNNCTNSSSYNLVQPDSLHLELLNIQLPSSTNDDGSALINIVGGTPPYIISWNDSYLQNTLEADSLSFGVYVVTVTDDNDCVTFLEVVLTEDPLIVSIELNQNNCFDECTASVILSIEGGVQPYMAMWSTAQTGLQLTNLCPGAVTVTVTDAANNQFISSEQLLLTPTELIISETISPLHCPTINDAAINIRIAGGQSPYIYNWSNGATTDHIHNISSGRYQLTVSDFLGCQSEKEFIIEELTLINLIAVKGDWDCIDKSYSIEIVGEIPDSVEIQLNGLAAIVNEENIIDQVAPGFYEIAYQLPSNCVVEFDSLVFGDEEELMYNIQLNIDTIRAVVGEAVQLSATIDWQGVSSSFNTAWSTDQEYQCLLFDDNGACLTTELIVSSEGFVDFVFTDEQGCEFVQQIPIILLTSTNVFVPNVFSPNNDGVNDVFIPLSNENPIIKRFSIFDRWGNVVFNRELVRLDEMDAWVGERSDKVHAEGVYVFILEVETKAGAIEILSGDITLIR